MNSSAAGWICLVLAAPMDSFYAAWIVALLDAAITPAAFGRKPSKQ